MPLVKRTSICCLNCSNPIFENVDESSNSVDNSKEQKQSEYVNELLLGLNRVISLHENGSFSFGQASCKYGKTSIEQKWHCVNVTVYYGATIVGAIYVYIMPNFNRYKVSFTSSNDISVKRFEKEKLQAFQEIINSTDITVDDYDDAVVEFENIIGDDIVNTLYSYFKSKKRYKKYNGEALYENAGRGMNYDTSQHRTYVKSRLIDKMISDGNVSLAYLPDYEYDDIILIEPNEKRLVLRCGTTDAVTFSVGKSIMNGFSGCHILTKGKSI